jgi:hypothetical protein
MHSLGLAISVAREAPPSWPTTQEFPKPRKEALKKLTGI